MADRQMIDLRELFERINRAVGGMLDSYEFSKIPVPSNMLRRFVFEGKEIAVDVHAWQGNELAFGRVIHLDAGDDLQIFNLLFYPIVSSPAPAIMCEILAVNQQVQLFVLDAYPTNAKHHVESVLRPIREAKEQLAGREIIRDIPEWGEKVFSKHALFLRPQEGGKIEHVAELVLLLESLFEPWLQSLPQDEGEHEVDDMTVLRRKRHILVHAQHEPLGPYLARIADPEWMRLFLMEILFPVWLKEGDVPAPWLEQSPLQKTVQYNS